MERQDTKGKGVDAGRDGSAPAYSDGYKDEEPPRSDSTPSPPVDTDTDDPPAPPGPSRPKASPLAPYRPFPAYMTLQNIREVSRAAIRSLHLCGASASDVLYTVSAHTGYSHNRLLGANPGYVLHNGTDMKAPPLACTKDRQRYFDAGGIVVLPALPSSGGKKTVEETLKAGRAADGAVVFWFGIEVGVGEKGGREEFEWRKVKKGVGSSEAAGYELSRRAGKGEGGAAAGSGVMAVLAWDRDGSLLNRKREFVLDLMGVGLSEALGERWRLMVVMTALRLAWLRVAGRTTRVGLTIQEKLRGKEK